MKNALYQKRSKPIRIKSLKELDPTFKPIWFRICFRLVLVGMISMIALVVGAIINVQWITWIGLVAVGVVGVTIFLIETGSKVLSFAGYWFPWAGLKAAQIEAWLERDLNWGSWK